MNVDSLISYASAKAKQQNGAKAHKPIVNEQLNGALLTLDREKLDLWIMYHPQNVIEALEFFVPSGAREQLPESVQITPYNRAAGYSGYDYRIGNDCHARVGFAPLRWGGFAFHKFYSDSQGKKELWEVFGSDGRLISTQQHMQFDLLYVTPTEMDPRCPILSHLYNYLIHEYEQAATGQSNPKQIALIESFVHTLPAVALHKDPAILGIWRKARECETDPVLNWAERQKVLDSVFADRAKILQAKGRAHSLNTVIPALYLWLGDWKNRFDRFRLKPVSNMAGFSYKYTIGIMIWFFQTVRENIGYSMALAIYGPFTFYFITQPLNPHAMWAVGKVRSAYLEIGDRVGSLLQPGQVQGRVAAQAPPPVPATPTTTTTTITAAASASTAVAVVALPADISKRHLGMPLSTDIPEVDSQKWVDRMSNFKNMQIGHEENMQLSARLGRLEQLETQLNFPLIADSAWEETESYLSELATLRSALKNPSPEVITFFDEEQTRTYRIQMYIWDRVLRFIQDHPYVVMDQSKEQVYRDYYAGRSFLLLSDMTNKLLKRHPDIQKPSEGKALEAVANSFRNMRAQAPTILEKLRKNSKVFSQKDPMDGRELRSYMKRQWEILYLIQNKAQEASNNGLVAYTWSVRNTLWLLQSLYSVKKREIGLVFGTQSRDRAAVKAEIQNSIEPLYESYFYMMHFEFLSLKPELSEKLANDIEFRQRAVVIDTIESFLKDREKVLAKAI